MRRFEGFDKLIATCQQNRLIENDGRSLLSNHVSDSFLVEREALIENVASLENLTEEYNFAQTDIVNVPTRIAMKNSRILTILAVGALIPVANVLIASFFLWRLYNLQGWLHTDLPSIRDLWRRADTLSSAIFAISILCGCLLLTFPSHIQDLLSTFDPMLRNLVPITIVAYFLTAGLACWCWIKLRSRLTPAADSVH